MNTFRARSRAAKSYDLLPPERPKRQTAEERMARPVVFEDAEFVVLVEPRRQTARRADGAQRPFRPGNDNGGHNTAMRKTGGLAKDTLRVIGRGLRAGERGLRKLSENGFSAVIALAFLIVFAMTGGLTALARTGDGNASRGPADFSHVTVSLRTVDGLPMMVVSGLLENTGDKRLLSPRLRADVYSGITLVSSTLFDPRLGSIASGESRGFQVKLPQTGGKSPDVRLSLAE